MKIKELRKDDSLAAFYIDNPLSSLLNGFKETHAPTIEAASEATASAFSSTITMLAWQTAVLESEGCTSDAAMRQPISSTNSYFASVAAQHSWGNTGIDIVNFDLGEKSSTVGVKLCSDFSSASPDRLSF